MSYLLWIEALNRLGEIKFKADFEEQKAEWDHEDGSCNKI